MKTTFILWRLWLADFMLLLLLLLDFRLLLLFILWLCDRLVFMSLLLPILCYYWIEFYVVMHGLKIFYGCCSKFYFSFYEKLYFLPDFISMSGTGRMDGWWMSWLHGVSRQWDWRNPLGALRHHQWWNHAWRNPLVLMAEHPKQIDFPRKLF